MSPQFEDSAQAQLVASAKSPAANAPSVSPAARVRRDPSDPPTRERKLKAVTYDQVDAARALIKPQPTPKRKSGAGGDKIVFEPDDTPADAEAKVGPVNKKNPGPLPGSASAELQARKAQIRAARAAITPNPAPTANVRTNTGCAGDAADGIGSVDTANSGNDISNGSPVLSDAEMDQIIALVQSKYGPILNIDQAAEVSKLAKQTIRERVSYKMYADSVVRGRPLRFWAHRFVKEVMR